MEQAIIAGSNGLVGSAVVSRLLLYGVEVLSLGRKRSENRISSDTYLEIDMNNINNLANELKKINWKPKKSCVFYNFSWEGNSTLTNGTLEQQMNNVLYSVEAVKVAKQLGCSKFVSCGTLEETYCEENLSNPNSNYQLTQKNYVVAKLASRDYSKYTAYSVGIDYIHTRLSVPFSVGFTRHSFIENNLRLIMDHKPAVSPTNNNIFDLVNVNEIADAFLKIGLLGKNLSDYYIGSKSPGRLEEYFAFTRESLEHKKNFLFDKLNMDTSRIFDTSLLQKHTGYVPTSSFINYIRSL